MEEGRLNDTLLLQILIRLPVINVPVVVFELFCCFGGGHLLSAFLFELFGDCGVRNDEPGGEF